MGSDDGSSAESATAPFAKLIVDHLLDINDGKHLITYDDLEQTEDPDLQEVLAGLMYLSEDLQFARAAIDKRTAEVEAAHEELRGLNETLEERIAERTRELERSNYELEQYAYAASHDLRAPLRAIANLVTWLEEDLSDSLTEETASVMNLIRGRADRMDKLLTDLLAHNRAGQHRRIESVDLAQIVQNTVEMIGGSEKVEVIIHSGLPTLMTNRLSITRVMSNLIENAAKHCNRDIVRIEITANDVGERWAFSVSDDGPGIPPELRERAFSMFEMLQSRDEVEGSGMGLALVKKHVTLIGGEVTLGESTSGGCSVRFTWPKVWPTSP